MRKLLHDIFHHRYFILLLTILSFGCMVCYIFINQDCEGGEDNMSLYMRSRFGLYHPIAFYREPIKILYVMLMSLPAQLGFKAMQITNAMLACATALLSVQIAKYMGLKNNWWLVVLTLFSPIYFLISLSVLSEIMFAFTLVLSIYLIYRDKYIWAAVCLSWLPFIRSEGFVLDLVFIVYFLLQKRWKALPWMLLGTFVFSMTGYPYHQKMAWVFTENYGNASSIYGHGPWYDFIKGSLQYNNPMITYLLPIALLMVFYKFKYLIQHQRNFIILIVGCYFGFLLLHSYLWWQGKGASLGLMRVMASVAPLASIIVVWLFSQFEKYLYKVQNGLGVVLASITIYYCFTINHFPIRLDAEHTVVAKLYELSKPYLEKAPEIKFNSTYFAFLADLDPYDTKKSGDCLTVKKHVLDSMKSGSVVQYETHFGPNECSTDTDFYDKLRPDFEKVLEVYPDVRFKVLNGYEYKNVLYRKK